MLELQRKQNLPARSFARRRNMLSPGKANKAIDTVHKSACGKLPDKDHYRKVFTGPSGHRVRMRRDTGSICPASRIALHRHQVGRMRCRLPNTACRRPEPDTQYQNRTPVEARKRSNSCTSCLGSFPGCVANCHGLSYACTQRRSFPATARTKHCRRPRSSCPGRARSR